MTNNPNIHFLNKTTQNRNNQTMKTISILLLVLSISACAPIFVDDDKSLGDSAFSPGGANLRYLQQTTNNSFKALPNSTVGVE